MKRLFLLILLTSGLLAQDGPSAPPAPEPQGQRGTFIFPRVPIEQVGINVVPSSAPPSAKRSWLNTETKIELAVVFGSLAADGYTTVWNWKGMTRSHEINPLIQPQNTTETSLYFLGCASGLAGSNYLLRNHPMLRRILNLSVAANEAYFVHFNTSHHLSRVSAH